MSFDEMTTHQNQMAGATRFLRLLTERPDLPDEQKQFIRLLGFEVLAEMGIRPVPTRIPTNPATHEAKGTPL